MIVSKNFTKDVPLHGGQLRHISERFSIPVSDLIDFSANINPDGLPPNVLSTLRACLEDLSGLTSYPDLEDVAFKDSIATYCGTSPHHVVVTNGFVPLFECALRTLKIKRCILPEPAFVEYRRSLTRCGVEIEPHLLTSSTGFQYDVHALIDGEHDADAIVLANPQNPSGVLTRKETVLDLVRICASRNITVFLDEAFIDYAPLDSLTPDVERFTNLVVFRSVTKFHGIPGLRISYAVTNPSSAKLLNENLPPWPVTTLASRAAAEALKDDAFAASARQRNDERRTQLRIGLEAQGVRVYPSAGNYLLFRLPGSEPPERFWERMILEHHLVLRNCSNYEGLPAGHFRSAVRTEVENEILIRAVSKVLSGP